MTKGTRVIDPPGALRYRRRTTRVVRVGDVGVGGDNPIRVQSMTTPATTDTEATVAQIVRLVEAGCEIVRLTVPTSSDADNLPNIRAALAERGVRVPLVADIHFTPAAALKAVEHVEKIRINPGNFADKKRFAVRVYSDAEYAAEIERIERAFAPLVLRCKELGAAMRIGTNHGSLSDRILNRYGDTPEGMVESALEFVRICEAYGYGDLILSMKASNPVVALRAYRLLVERMDREGMDYPLHLGVTEAGDGEDGRIKSAIGIGALLEEGIGDTVRVSLTEDPVAEIPVARALVAPFNSRAASPALPGSGAIEIRSTERRRRETDEVAAGPRRIGGSAPVAVEVPLLTPVTDEDGIRREIDAQSGARVPEDTRAEILSVRVRSRADRQALARLRRSLDLVAPGVALSARIDSGSGEWPPSGSLDALPELAHRIHVTARTLFGEGDRRRMLDLLDRCAASGSAVLLEAGSASGSSGEAIATAVEAARAAPRGRLLIAVDPSLGSPFLVTRRLAARLDGEGLGVPLVLLDRPSERGTDPLLGPSSALGGLLCEGIGDAIQIAAATSAESRRLAFNILQAARLRITKTEFISCPSCGRTLFDLETTTSRIKARTAHLKGVKIAVMGCVVNGPGEMADADFGYVGWGENRIALFVGRELVEKDVPTDLADERLVELIKRHGRWIEPPPPAGS